MTKNETKDLVAKKIEGQGTNVDAGSVLPAILNSIIDTDAAKAEVDDFEEFDTATAYTAGDIVRNDGKLYKFTANKSAGAWDASKVSQTNILSILTALITSKLAELPRVFRLTGPIDTSATTFDELFEDCGINLTLLTEAIDGKITGFVTNDGVYMPVTLGARTEEGNPYRLDFVAVGYTTSESALSVDTFNGYSIVVQDDGTIEIAAIAA